MSETSDSLATALPSEMERCRELSQAYGEIGPADRLRQGEYRRGVERC